VPSRAFGTPVGVAYRGDLSKNFATHLPRAQVPGETQRRGEKKKTRCLCVSAARSLLRHRISHRVTETRRGEKISVSPCLCGKTFFMTPVLATAFPDQDREVI